MRRRNAAANVNRAGGPVARRERPGGCIFASTIGFLVREVMSVPRRNAIMRLGRGSPGGTIRQSIFDPAQGIVTAMKSCLNVLE